MIGYDAAAWQKAPGGFIAPEGCFAEPDRAAQFMIREMFCIGHNIQSMVEYGCCDGRFIRWFRNAGYRGTYLGVDITPAFLHRARQDAPGEAFVHGDVQTFNVGQRQDLVFCANVLMHLPEPELAAKRLFDQSKRYVMLSVYGTDKEQTESFHDATFLNWRFPKDRVKSWIREGWHGGVFPIEPEWDPSARIYVLTAEKE